MTCIDKRIVGVDIGGANLKYARGDGVALASPFAMWRQCDQLADVMAVHLRRLTEDGFIAEALAVTMTGELADCFSDRAHGVRHLVQHSIEAAARAGIDRIAFYGVDGKFHSGEQACRDVDLVAAANWHALASFVGCEIAANATLVDIGSTTTDIIPVRDGSVATTARTDFQRLCEGSLVYVGCRRTPVCALLDRVDFRDQSAAVMNEWFATIDDARLLLRTTEEDPRDIDTADGKPRTRRWAANRLARMIGLDLRTVSVDEMLEVAHQVVRAARQRIDHAMRQTDHNGVIVISGHGNDLIGDLPQELISVTERIGAEASRCAPSYAVARLLNSETAPVCDPCVK